MVRILGVFPQGKHAVLWCVSVVKRWGFFFKECVQCLVVCVDGEEMGFSSQGKYAVLRCVSMVKRRVFFSKETVQFLGGRRW